MIRANKKDKKLIVNILSESFQDNKSVNFIFSKYKNKNVALRNLMNYSFDVGYRHGDIFLSNDKKACCIILLPHKKENKLKDFFKDLKLIFGVIGLCKLFSVLKKEKIVKINHPKTPYAHLWYIGVEKSSQHQGIGSKLLEEIVVFYKNKNLDIYLETSTKENIPFYSRYGFNIFNHNNDFGFKFNFLKN